MLIHVSFRINFVKNTDLSGCLFKKQDLTLRLLRVMLSMRLLLQVVIIKKKIRKRVKTRTITKNKFIYQYNKNSKNIITFLVK